jgi:hypothetical protein
MPLPTLSKSGVTTVTFSKGRAFAVAHDEIPTQILGETDDPATVVVADLGAEAREFGGTWTRLPLADVQAVLTFFRHTNVRWSKNTITWTDEAGTATTVRLLLSSLRYVQVASGLYDLTLHFRES